MEQQYCCNKPSSSSSCKAADRKTIEKNRRNQMKDLYMKLNSLVHHDQHSKEFLSLPDQLEEAADYIKKLQIDLEKLRLKKESLTAAVGTLNSNSSSNTNGRILENTLPLPHIEIHSVNAALEVLLITGLDYHFMFNHIIRMLHEDGVQVINASYTLVGDTIFHSIHSKVGESATLLSGYGAAAKIISEKLKQFVGAAAT
ncbi:transcription factor bHLH162-like [Solanum stenotomum]|uniref:transcription factor bHLH162-like n=1 Tax=Solanum stenotomum TaxID=172797 RepID=UPI0020D12E18|nr:transcription factor bHLH162-like [Solanum stenotomum]